jgi:hypothetical protein
MCPDLAVYVPPLVVQGLNPLIAGQCVLTPSKKLNT